MEMGETNDAKVKRMGGQVRHWTFYMDDTRTRPLVSPYHLVFPKSIRSGGNTKGHSGMPQGRSIKQDLVVRDISTTVSFGNR